MLDGIVLGMFVVVALAYASDVCPAALRPRTSKLVRQTRTWSFSLPWFWLIVKDRSSGKDQSSLHYHMNLHPPFTTNIRKPTNPPTGTASFPPTPACPAAK